MSAADEQNIPLNAVAIIGMAGRFPGAVNIAEFWQNQLRGVESISRFRVEDLRVPNAAELMNDGNYIPVRAILKDIDLFDAEFFGILPKEAEMMDPQQRIFLECCWEAFENAGHDPANFAGAVGVFAGSSFSSYFLANLATQPGFLERFTANYQIGDYAGMMGNSPDFLSTRVSYKLNLRGPSFTMQSACSTSLLAVCQACQSLLSFQSDMALAGAVSIPLPQERGYMYQEGGMGSADGHCRTFDADAQGTVFGSGAGVVLLKRLEDALADGDNICSVIRGYSVNNDGAAKVGYTAPSVEGQANVIAMAHEAAAVDPATIGYIEAHGTATPLGDPIELSALDKAFRAHTAKKSFCAIGTVKTNVGHLDVAAGVTGLIHATQIVRNAKLPPTLHFNRPTDAFDLADSPFFVNTTLADWKQSDHPRRAGVSAFGVGGTNAHVILEEPPEMPSQPSPRKEQLLLLSARSADALDVACNNLACYLRSDQEINLADVAFTLQVGRRAFDHRRMLVAKSAEDSAVALATKETRHVRSCSTPYTSPNICFLFPGQGSQQPNMGRELYDSEEVFRNSVDQCCEILKSSLGMDLRDALYPVGKVTDEGRDRITQTILAQPAIFVVEYALAMLWISWGIEPSYMIGHSIGEFTAACLAGVLQLEDALHLIAVRGRLMQDLPRGAMLSVRASEAEVRNTMGEHLSIAAVNAPALCVVSGPIFEVETLQATLGELGIVSRMLHTSHAFHSAMMEPIMDRFTAEVKQMRLNAPKIPYISGVSGNWITAAQATDPAYWAQHLRQTVQFSRGVARIREMENVMLLETGPGSVLATLARQHTSKSKDQIVVSSLTDGTPDCSEISVMQQSLGMLWMGGVKPDWHSYHAGAKRRRVELPTYPFERKRFWLDACRLAIDLSVRPTQKTPETTASFQVTNMEETSIMVPTLANQSLRQNKIRTMLAEIFEDLSGMDLSKADDSASFLELGFDSLFLTQVTQSLQSKFSLKITFRQLLSDLSSMGALASYVDDKLPADMFREATSTSERNGATPLAAIASNAPVVSSSSSPIPSGTGVEQLMRDQLVAMNQLFAVQLATLQGNGNIAHANTAPNPGVQAISPTLQAVPTKETETIKELKGYSPFKPLQKSITGDLTPRQERYIAELSARYTRRTAGSKAKTQEYRAVLADPRVASGFRLQWKEMVYPIVTKGSKGSRLWDIDGNEYIDLLNGFGPIMLGHRPQFLEDAIARQLHEGFEVGPQTLLAGEAASLICELTGNERATFCNTGSEAVIAALRVARTVTGRTKVVYFAGDYHGMFDEVLMKGIRRGGEPQAIPIAPGIPREAAANMVVLEYGADESLDWIRHHASELAAVIVEPVQSRHPELRPLTFLRELRKVTAESGTCFIFDEVVTGFRTHPGGCQALFDIRADLATYGKVLAGGMPIGVLAGKAQYMDALDGGMWQYGDDSYPQVGVTFFAGTFVRHPLAMAACVAVLRYLKEAGPGLQESLNERTSGLVQRLNSLLDGNQVPAHIESYASYFFLSFPGDYRFGSLFYYQLREKGIHLLEGFPCFLTTAHTDADIDTIVRAFEETIREMQDGGVLPAPHRAQFVAPVTIMATASSAPLTESQREIFLAATLDETASCAFNESFTLNLHGTLRADLLRESLNLLIERHEALRATVNADGETLDVHPQLTLDPPFINLSALPLPERQTTFRALLDKDARTAFNLCDGPLIRAQLVCFEADHHALVFTSHHIICDGWSTAILMNDLANIYEARLRGVDANLAPALAFGEYAREQHTRLQSAADLETEAYWLTQFRELPHPLDLPLDRPRSNVKSYAGATYRTTIGHDQHVAIKQLGMKHGCTLFVTLLAGFEALIHRLSTQNDIVVGIPVAGQALLDNKSLVGHCVNFLPIRAQFHEDLTFDTLLRTTKTTLLDAYDNQAYTYGTLVRRLGMKRDPSRLPLMEVQFNLEKLSGTPEIGGMRVDLDPNPKSAVNFDLFFNVVEGPEELIIDCDYNTDLFDEATVARWLGHYVNLLLAAGEKPGSAVDSLPLMTQMEVTSLLEQMNPCTTTSLVTTTIHKVFEEHALVQPDAIAITLGTESMTYGDLNARANQLARVLRREGAKADSLIAVCFERSLEMIVSLLAVLKAGAAYLPIDSSYPAERLTMILEDANPAMLLTQQRIVTTIPKTTAKLICVDAEWTSIALESESNLSEIAKPDNLAYVIYTSGSTGAPKGVMVTHANVLRLMTATKSWFQFCPDDVWTLFHSYAFDFSVWEIWGSLMTGGRLVIVPFWITRSPKEFYDLIVLNKVSVLNQTPAALQQIIEVEESGYTRPLSLRYIILGGEALNFANLRPWFHRHGDVRPQIINMYGITETTVHVTYRPVHSAECEYESRSLIGTPISDLRLYLLDSRQHPVPRGVVGEIYVGGNGVARGYLNRPQLSADRFLIDPFSGSDGDRMYKSGDLARLLANGDLEYLGRGDMQVKIHGFRIELGEIEATLARHPSIQQTVVVLSSRVTDKLVAYYVPVAGASISGAELTDYLKAKLPIHMVPYYYVALEALPLTTNGKVDRSKLPSPDLSTVVRGHEYVAPTTEQEKTLTGILADVLKLQQVGVTDNLFELGADSLHVFQITSRAAQAGLSITPRMLLELHTASAVLAAMEIKDAPVRSMTPSIRPVARTRYVVAQEIKSQ